MIEIVKVFPGQHIIVVDLAERVFGVGTRNRRSCKGPGVSRAGHFKIEVEVLAPAALGNIRQQTAGVGRKIMEPLFGRPCRRAGKLHLAKGDHFGGGRCVGRISRDD